MGEPTPESVFTSGVLKQLNEQLFRRKQELNAKSKTSQLWLKYQSMVKVARTLVAADRSSTWLKHLHAVSDCLPIFAVAGHYNYLKSAFFYVQEMSQLELKYINIFRKFQQGFHVIPRSNKFYDGLSSAPMIEQTQMWLLKSSGGLTRGNGI